jgi:hypothetical protein
MSRDFTQEVFCHESVSSLPLFREYFRTFLAPELSTTAIVNDKGENILITVIINCLRAVSEKIKPWVPHSIEPSKWKNCLNKNIIRHQYFWMRPKVSSGVLVLLCLLGKSILFLYQNLRRGKKGDKSHFF